MFYRQILLIHKVKWKEEESVSQIALAQLLNKKLPFVFTFH